MNHSTLLDGSDAQDRSASSHSERCAALKRHIHDVVIILESFDQTSRDDLKQDEQYNDLVNRFVSTFTSFPLPDFVSRVDQVIKNGLKDIATSITELAIRGVTPLGATLQVTKRVAVEQRLSSACASSSTLPLNLVPPLSLGANLSLREAPGSGEDEEVAGTSTVTATIHFLIGTTNCTSAQIINLVNRALAAADGHVDIVGYTHQDSGSAVAESIRMILTYSGSSSTMFHALRTANLSSLWTRNAVTYIREGGTIAYGLRVSSPATTREPFHNPTSIGHPFTSQLVRSEMVSEINEVYLQRLREDRQSIKVASSLGGGVYMFSGPTAQDLEDIVAGGKRTVNFFISQFPAGGRSFEAVIEPFRLG